MIYPEELITLHSEMGARTYTRAELEALADAGVLPSSLGAEDPEILALREEPVDDDLFSITGQCSSLN